MTIASEITRIKTNIENAYIKAEEKGATIPEVKNSENLASCVETITTGGGSGGSELAGYQVIDGVATKRSGEINGAFDDIVIVDQNAFYYTFYNNTDITGKVSFPNVTEVRSTGFNNTFYNCTNLTEVSFESLETIEGSGFSYCFYGCTNLTKVDFKSLKYIKSNGLNSTFYDCTNLASVNFASLTKLDNYALINTFQSCKGLTSVSFPSLTQISSYNSLNNTFKSCTNLTEIHFRADMQSKIESFSNFSSKFGATNATIYFDL